MENKTIFDLIIEGSIPSFKLYEDDKVLVILDINPINKGHSLVIPKAKSVNFTDLDDETYSYTTCIVKKIADKLMKTYEPPKIGVIIEGFEVPHTHIHVFPAYSAEDFRKNPEDKLKLTDKEMANIAESLRIN